MATAKRKTKRRKKKDEEKKGQAKIEVEACCLACQRCGHRETYTDVSIGVHIVYVGASAWVDLACC